jgi:hypothetical protein
MVNFSVFNELSLPFSTDINIVDNFIEFFQLLSVMKSKGLNTLRLSQNLKNYNVLENVSFQQFIGQQNDLEFKRRIISLLMNNGIILIDSPIIKDEDKNEHDIIKNCEYLHDKRITAGGLACCDIWNTIAVSFNSDIQWDTDSIILNKQSLSDDGELVQHDIEIKHASKSGHLETHQQFFKKLEEETKLSITQETFWEQKNKYFPDIIVFCPEIESQIKKLDKLVFQQAISILRDVETQQKSMTDFNHSGESTTIHNNDFLKKLREFTINGNKVFFEQHIKSFPNAYRMYFLEQDGHIYIGYIGKHLKGKKDK